ncbi:MAG: hypothetical protein EHM84_06140, partial [Lysobacterales bacterium]
MARSAMCSSPSSASTRSSRTSRRNARTATGRSASGAQSEPLRVNFPRATISSEALRNNLAVVRRLAPESRVLAAVKANAYGHGLVPSARALAGVDAFGLARLDEALILRNAGLSHPLVLLEGVVCAEDLQAAGAHEMEIVVHAFDQIQMLEAYRGAHRFVVWLKIDTGMHRLGMAPEDFPDAYHRLARCGAVGSLRLMTHLAAAEASD